MRLLRNIYFLLAVVFFTFILDRLFKNLVLNKGGFSALHDFLKINLYPNGGIALSLPASRFIIYPLIILILIIVFYFLFLGLKKHDYLLIWGMALIFVGASSNLIDRLRFGNVIDYLNFSGFFPVFNFADVMIVAGAGLFLLKSLGKDHLTNILE
ncbi:MAG: signal peptidase II [Patescibacteria group bacterium]